MTLLIHTYIPQFSLSLRAVDHASGHSLDSYVNLERTGLYLKIFSLDETCGALAWPDLVKSTNMSLTMAG